MDIQAPIPNKALLTWCKANADKIAVLDHYAGGWCDDNGNDRPHYEIVLSSGWHFTHGGSHKIVSDTSGAYMLRCLKDVERCPSNCSERF